MATKIFSLADGHSTIEITIAMLEHKVREPARNVNMVPALAIQYFLSSGKFSDAGYVSVCNMVSGQHILWPHR